MIKMICKIVNNIVKAMDIVAKALNKERYTYYSERTSDCVYIGWRYKRIS